MYTVTYRVLKVHVNTTPFCDGTQALVPLHQVIILGARVILICNSKVKLSHTSFCERKNELSGTAEGEGLVGLPYHFFAGIYFLGLQLTWKTLSWNYWTFP